MTGEKKREEQSSQYYRTDRVHWYPMRRKRFPIFGCATEPTWLLIVDTEIDVSCHDNNRTALIDDIVGLPARVSFDFSVYWRGEDVASECGTLTEPPQFPRPSFLCWRLSYVSEMIPHSVAPAAFLYRGSHQIGTMVHASFDPFPGCRQRLVEMIVPFAIGCSITLRSLSFSKRRTPGIDWLICGFARFEDQVGRQDGINICVANWPGSGLVMLNLLRTRFVRIRGVGRRPSTLR